MSEGRKSKVFYFSRLLRERSCLGGEDKGVTKARLKALGIPADCIESVLDRMLQFLWCSPADGEPTPADRKERYREVRNDTKRLIRSLNRLWLQDEESPASHTVYSPPRSETLFPLMEQLEELSRWTGEMAEHISTRRGRLDETAARRWLVREIAFELDRAGLELGSKTAGLLRKTVTVCLERLGEYGNFETDILAALRSVRHSKQATVD